MRRYLYPSLHQTLGSQRTEWVNNVFGQVELAQIRGWVHLMGNHISLWMSLTKCNSPWALDSTYSKPHLSGLGLWPHVCTRERDEERRVRKTNCGFESDRHKADTFSQSNDTSSTWQRLLRMLWLRATRKDKMFLMCSQLLLKHAWWTAFIYMHWSQKYCQQWPVYCSVFGCQGIDHTELFA